MNNGKQTYSKTPFKESKHERSPSGIFKDKTKTEEDTVEYHHAFTEAYHPRKADGSFSNEILRGIERYGRKD